VQIDVLEEMSLAGCRWLTPVILATQKAEIRRMEIQGQSGQIVHETLSRKNLSQKRTGRVVQGVGPESNPQYRKKKKKKKERNVSVPKLCKFAI
jgi:hypothetical protein